MDLIVICFKYIIIGAVKKVITEKVKKIALINLACLIYRKPSAKFFKTVLFFLVSCENWGISTNISITAEII